MAINEIMEITRRELEKELVKTRMTGFIVRDILNMYDRAMLRAVIQTYESQNAPLPHISIASVDSATHPLP